MAIDIVLVLATFVSALIGILASPRGWTRVALIALAACTSTGTLIKAHQDNRSKDFTTGALGALLASSIPPESFEKAWGHGFSQVAKRHHLILTENTIEGTKGHIFYFNDPLGNLQGVLPVSPDETGKMWADYVYHQPMDDDAESMMYRNAAIKNDQDLGDELEKLAVVGWFAISKNVPGITNSPRRSSETMNYNPRRAGAVVQVGTQTISVSIEEDFINKILDLPPAQRYYLAYVEFKRQLDVRQQGTGGVR